MVLELSLPKPGGMCYRHKLTWLIYGFGINRVNLWAVSELGLKQRFKKACKSAPARVFGPYGPCIFRFNLD